MNFKKYFDRVVLINLKRRPDRLERVSQELRRSHWPFKQPEVFEAIDGYALPPPPHWRLGPGTWGCLKSHQLILEQAIADGVGSLLILEDDVCFADDFKDKVGDFLRKVPDDWDQLMIGGQHLNSHGKPTLIKPGVFRCTDCRRTHCHAVRGDYIGTLQARILGGGKYNGLGMIDEIMGGDPKLQFVHKVYAPQFFLAGQERGQSDIKKLVLPRKFWNPPGRKLSVINLHAPTSVIDELREYGFCTGQGCGQNGDLDQTLVEIFATTRVNSRVRRQKLRDWIKLMQWELASDPGFICTVAHPKASVKLVQEASLWKVHEIIAANVKDALAQLPHKFREILGMPSSKRV